MTAPDLTPAQRTEIELLARGKQAKSRALRELGQPETPEAAHATLLRLGLWDAGRLPHADRLGVDLTDLDLPVPVFPDEPRLDLTHLPALAIDDAGNRDPDDAVSLETLPDGTRRLWVHVADVAALAAPDSPLDLAARARGATLYLPDRTVGMLPEAVVEQVGLGLHPESPALSISIDFDEDGNADTVDVQLTRLRVTRLSYEEAQTRLDGGDPLLRGLLDLANASKQLRDAEGAIHIDLPEVRVRVTDGQVQIEPLPKYPSRFIVQECMTLAGWASAIFADDLEVPLPFATQDAPHSQVRGGGEDYVLHWARRKTLARTRFQPALGPHHGMGLDAYAQATSPMRRYLDLVVHQQLRAAILEQPTLPGREIAARVAEANLAADAVRQAERQSRKHWTLVYLQQHPEQVYEAVVVDRRGPQATLLLPALALDAPLTTPAAPGTALQVQAAEVDLPRLQVRLRGVNVSGSRV